MNSQNIDKILDSLTPKEFLPRDQNKFLVAGKLEQFFKDGQVFDPSQVSKVTKAKNYFQKITQTGTEELSKGDQDLLVERVNLLNENLCK